MKQCMALLLLLLLTACGHGVEKKHTPQRYAVQAEHRHKTLYFTGSIQPLSESSLIAPMDASVERMAYHYGQLVEKDATVFTLNAVELQKQYNDALTDYLKTKDNFNVIQVKFTGTTDLWKAGLISKNNYLSEKSSLNAARVSLMQANRKLCDLLEKMGKKTDDQLSRLSFAQFDKVRMALRDNYHQLYIKSPSTGVLLYPPKTSDDKTGHLSVGASVKTGQVLALIGDLSGIRIEIDVPEVDLENIHNQMPATVHGVGFSKDVLRGQLIAINAQATPSTGGGLPSFTAIIEVRTLTPAQQERIKVGMSASVELMTDSVNQLMIPIKAITQSQGLSLVRVQGADGRIHEKTVVTGATEGDKVVIESGLQVGEEVLYG